MKRVKLDPRIKLVDVTEGYAVMTLRNSPVEEKISSKGTMFVSQVFVGGFRLHLKTEVVEVPARSVWRVGGDDNCYLTRAEAANSAIEGLLDLERYLIRREERDK